MAWLNINGNCGTFDRYYNLLRYRTRKLVWGSFGPFDYKFSQQGNTVVNAVGRSDSSDTNAVQRLVVENTSTAAYKDITVDVSELCCTTSNNMYTFGYTIPLDHDGVVSSNQVLYEYTNDATTTHCFDAKPSLSLKGIRRSGTAHMAVHDINVPAGVDRRTVRKRTGKGLKRLINANKTSGGFV